MKRHGIFCFFLLSLAGISSGSAQQISFSVKNETLENVFLLIEKQTNYHFIYSTEDLADATSVSLSVKDATINDVLKKCLRGQPVDFAIHEDNITIRRKERSTSFRSLEGHVLNTKGEPVPGITVAIKGTSIVAISDLKGYFLLDQIPPDAILLATGAEIEPIEIPVGVSRLITVQVIQKINTLDETYVIAYGQSSRRAGTGTVSSVKAADISRQPVSNALSILAGRVPGLQVQQVSGVPGSFIRLQLRGINSIANGKSPLIILDGVPFPADPFSGSLGGGAGVSASPLNSINPDDIESIEILKDADATAIYGSRGANGVILITSKKPIAGALRVNLRLQQGWGKITRGMKLMDNARYLAMRREAFANDGVQPTIYNAPDLLQWDTSRYTDWQKVLIGNTMENSMSNLSVSGGNADAGFLLAIGWDKQSTVFPGDFGDDRKSVLLRVNHSPEARRLHLNFSSSFSHYRQLLPQQDFLADITLAPDAPALYDAAGKLNWADNSWVNPMSHRYATFLTTTDNLNSSAELSYRLLNQLRFYFSGGYSAIWSTDLQQTPQAAYNPIWGVPSSAGFGSKRIQTTIAEPRLAYEDSYGFGNLSALIGASFQETHEKGLYQSATGYATDELLSSIRAASSVAIFSESDIDYKYAGVFARLGYDYRKKYIISLTGRRDGSSRYGLRRRFANFGSAAFAWVFSKENFFTNSRLSFGKLKFSMGKTGNDQIGDYKYLSIYTPSSYSYLGVTPLAPVQLSSPDYSWELVNKWELGLDLGFFQDRLLLSAGYYHHKTRNQLVNYPLPDLTGFSSVLRNVPAIISNVGLEITVVAQVVNRKNWNWESSLNVTVPRTKLIKFDNLGGSSYARRYAIGQSLSIQKRYRYLGLDPETGTYQFEDFNQDGRISAAADQQEIVDLSQQYYGGWQNTVSYRHFSFSMLFQFVRQKNGANYLSLFGLPGGDGNQPAFLEDRWRQKNDAATYQRYSYSNSAAANAYFYYTQSNAAFSDASYLRLRNLSVSYDFELRKRIAGCKVFAQAQNLLTITSYQGMDPENQSGGLPPIRLMVLGVQLSL